MSARKRGMLRAVTRRPVRSAALAVLAVLVVGGGLWITAPPPQPEAVPPQASASVPPAPAPGSAPPSAAQVPPAPPLPSAAEVAQAPHPPVEESPNPPATETGRDVVEDEPPPQRPGPGEPPLPHAAPRDRILVAALPPPGTQGQPPTPTVTAPPTAAPAPSAARQPDWERYAVMAPAAKGRPTIAVIIDDMGLDRKRSKRILDLPGPLTISFMSYADDLAEQAAEAHARGDELMMHVPMEPLDDKLDTGPGALLSKLPPAEIRKRLEDDLARFTGYVGINNHMGSKFTADSPGMSVVMEVLKERGLLFIDSLTTDKSVGLAVARRLGVPAAGRNVFLDDSADQHAVEMQLGKLEELARKKGNAIAIGHPRDGTIAALAAWLPTLEKKGFVLVPVSAIVRARMEQATSTAQAH